MVEGSIQKNGRDEKLIAPRAMKPGKATGPSEVQGVPK